MIFLFSSIATIAIVFAAVSALSQNLPDIPQPAIDFFINGVRMLYGLDTYLPVHEFFQYAGYLLLFLIIVLSMRIADDIRTAATGAKPIFKFFWG